MAATFEFGPDQVAAQEDLKDALLNSPALRPIDYASGAPVILSVDTSYIAIGFILSQCDPTDTRKRYFARFGSITLNDREARFSQPKLELYGLYRALHALKIYLIGIRNFVIEVDASAIRGMLNNPDINPSASMNRWILAILTFHFELVHVPGAFHGPDGLSRRPTQPADEPQEDDTDEREDWIDRMHGFLHIINPLRPSTSRLDTPPAFLYISSTPIYTNSDHPPATSNDAIPSEGNTEAESPPTPYTVIPRSAKAVRADDRMVQVREWLLTRNRPNDMTDTEYDSFVRYCAEFFLNKDRLWRRDQQGHHKLVVAQDRRMFIMALGHDDVGHHGFFATHAIISERYWWPFLAFDIAWFIRTCHLCQLRRTQNVLIPPTVAMPAPLFAKVYVDTMFLPLSGGFKLIIQARCSLCHYPEFSMLRRETEQTVGEFIFRNLICRYGFIMEIVTDNGPGIMAGVRYLAKRYNIKHIRISGYNSRANGIVERPHFDIRQALFKAANGDQSKWSQFCFYVFWADRVTIRKRMGCSPYFALTGTHPILPFDIVEANYLVPPPDSVLSTTDLIANRAIALQKRQEDLDTLRTRVYDARVKAARRFEEDHANTIRDYDFKLGNLVLIRNTQIEKALNRKMRARYLGPYIVISRNRGGAYILAELNGALFDRTVAAFRVIPYFARSSIPLPPLEDLLDVSQQRLREMEDSIIEDPDLDTDDLTSAE